LALAAHLSTAIRQAELFQQVQELSRTLEEKVQARTAQLDRQVQELQRLDRLKNDFLSTVSHELRTPLSNMKMAICLLSSVLLPAQGAPRSPDPAKISQYLKVLENECEREIRLVEDLLELQQLEMLKGLRPANANGSQRPCWLELQEWLPQIAEPFAQEAHSRHQRFSLGIPSELPAIFTLPGVLKSVLAELLKNACKFTPAGHLISLQATCHSDHLDIQVLNTGVTIPQEEQKRVFEKFYRVPSADPWRQGGTGLGLALVRQRVSLLQGSIHLNSEANHTCFTLRLPRVLPVFGQGKPAQPRV